MTPTVGRAIHELRDVLSEAMNLGFNLSEKLGWTRKIMGSLSESNEHAETSWNNFKQWFHECFTISSFHQFSWLSVSRYLQGSLQHKRFWKRKSGKQRHEKLWSKRSINGMCPRCLASMDGIPGCRWELVCWGWKRPSGKEQILVLPGRRWLQPRPLWNNATSELKLKACLKTLSILIHCKKLPCALVLCCPASLPFPVQGCFTCGAAHGWDPQWSGVCGENPRSGKAGVRFLSVSHGLRIQWRIRHALVN